MKLPLVLLAALAALGACATTTAPSEGLPPVATFSIVARDPGTGDLGVAVQSKFFGVGSVVPWARADVGAIATQAWANTTYGPRGLDLLAEGLSPAKVLEALIAADPGAARRQVGIVDAQGRAAAHTGEGAMAWAGHVTGEGYTCQGNILAGEEVVKAMARTYAQTQAPFPERLVAALRAGQAAGGDNRGRQSAALLVVRHHGGYSGFNDRYVDVRVEDHETPIEELARLLALHREFYPSVPVPTDLDKFDPEPEPDPTAGPLSSPRAAMATWDRLLRARDWEGLYATYTKAYRAAQPFAEWKAELLPLAEAIESFLDAATYQGTRRDGEKATVALAVPGNPRPVTTDLVLEDGEWRFVD